MRFICARQVDTVFFKNPRMHEMDDGIGDIQAQITDKQVQYTNRTYNEARGKPSHLGQITMYPSTVDHNMPP